MSGFLCVVKLVGYIAACCEAALCTFRLLFKPNRTWSNHWALKRKCSNYCLIWRNWKLLGGEFVSHRYWFVGTLKIRFKPLYAILAPVIVYSFSLVTVECCDYYSCDVTEALIRHVVTLKSSVACFEQRLAVKTSESWKLSVVYSGLVWFMSFWVLIAKVWFLNSRLLGCTTAVCCVFVF
jgi:hypothetical protein